MKNKVSDFIDAMIETNELLRFNIRLEAPFKKIEEFRYLFVTHYKSFLPSELYSEKDEHYISQLAVPFYWHYRILLGLKESTGFSFSKK